MSRFDFRSRRRIAGFTAITYDFSVTAYVHGLGYSFVDIRENTIGMDSRLWVLATPVDGTFIDLVLAGQVRDIRKTKRLIAGLGFLPVKLRTSFMNKIWTLMQKRDVLQDVEIWGRKELPASSEFVPLRRCHRQISALLQTVLSAWRQ